MSFVPVSVYYGGEICYGRFGAEYSIGPRLGFSVNEDTSFENLVNELCTAMQFSKDQYSVEIYGRVNAGVPGCWFFNILPVYDERSWRSFHDTVTIQMGMIELYVNLKPIQTFWSEAPPAYNLRAVDNLSDDAEPFNDTDDTDPR